MTNTQTLSRYIIAQQRKHPSTTGELSDLLGSVSLGVKLIRDLIATAGFRGLQGYTGKTNVQGESTHILDEQADEILIDILGSSGQFALLVSEERENVITTSPESRNAKYILAFDPLDGSSNLGSNIPVGTIFSIFAKGEMKRPAEEQDFLQPGRQLVAAGYALYGAKTNFVYSCGDGVHSFTLDPTIGEFVLTDENLRCPERGKIYSINEGNAGKWAPDVTKFVETMKSDDAELKTPYSARYVGSLVADFDRNLKKGGIYIYPSDSETPKGKLRLLYECIPLGFIAEQAGGMATNGDKEILDIVPESIHERSPLVIGSKFEVELFRKISRSLR